MPLKIYTNETASQHAQLTNYYPNMGINWKYKEKKFRIEFKGFIFATDSEELQEAIESGLASFKAGKVRLVESSPEEKKSNPKPTKQGTKIAQDKLTTAGSENESIADKGE